LLDTDEAILSLAPLLHDIGKALAKIVTKPCTSSEHNKKPQQTLQQNVKHTDYSKTTKLIERNV
jgi:hypothetical protein